MGVAERAGGVRLHWEEHGDPDGEPVVLIMGLSGSARPWWRLLPVLTPGRRVVALDNRGTGRSSAVTGRPPRLSMREMAADVVAVMDDAGLDDAHVVGASMGGMVAQHLGLDHRDRVRSLALCCTTPRGGGGMPPWRLLGATVLRPVLGPGRTLDLVAPALYARETRERHPERILEDMRVRMEDATPSSTVVAQLAAIGGHDTRGRLAELDGLPVTVIHGDEDGLVPYARGQELAAGIPGARLRTIAGAGHQLTTDRLDETAAALVGHLDGVLV